MISSELSRAATVRHAFLCLIVCIVAGPGIPVSLAASTAETADCLLAALAKAAPETTVARIRAGCDPTNSKTGPGAPEQQANTTAMPDPVYTANYSSRIAAEHQSLDRGYSLTPHNPNYLLVYSYNKNTNTFQNGENGDAGLDNEEAILQVSVKFPMWRKILGTDNDLLFSYTAKSWFQAYNDALSKPFRETNYEPEIFLRHYGGPHLGPVRIARWDIGYNHQSNGRSEPLSRSWDRLMGRVALDVTANLSMVLRAWYRLPESINDDDNPDIHRYLGYGDIRAVWAPNRNTFTAMFRPGTKEHGFEFSWSYPINKHFRIYTQYFNGYGDSLIDYNHRVERIGIGFAINDFLQVREP